MNISVGIVSLGCTKNQVDAELLMGTLGAEGFELKEDAALADVAIVNTCGFIETAKRESIEEILELAKLKEEGRIKKIVVTGCMAERYRDQIHAEIPEVDAVVGIGANADIAKLLRAAYEEQYVSAYPEKSKLPLCGQRSMMTPSYYAYLKIAEGCSNHCTYCAIPSIRGPYRSRGIDSIVAEARSLADNGAKELILIAQDTTRYGMDLYGSPQLAQLLRQLCEIDGIRWIRTLYCYPEAITDELLETVAAQPKLVKYFDIPLQHVSPTVLRRMNRHGDTDTLTALVEKIRKMVPGVTLRTTFITGFPGETEADFEALHRFVKAMRFDHMGCFPYSQEEDTPAAALPDQIDEATKQRRAEILAEAQMDILQTLGDSRVGTQIVVLTEGYDRYAQCWFGRSEQDAPDIDGKVFFTASENRPQLGQFVTVEIVDCIDGDLFGIRK